MKLAEDFRWHAAKMKIKLKILVIKQNCVIDEEKKLSVLNAIYIIYICQYLKIFKMLLLFWINDAYLLYYLTAQFTHIHILTPNIGSNL